MSTSASRGRLVPAMGDVLTGLVALALTGLEGASSLAASPLHLFVVINHGEPLAMP